MYTREHTEIANEVRRALAPHIRDMSHVSVSVENGIATLSGTVASEAERQGATTTVLTLPSVQNVKNDLRIADQGEHTVGEYIDDTLITTTVKGKMLAEPGIKSFAISVETERGVVTLTGNVDKPEQASLAEHVAKMVNGVKSVNNRLSYRP